LKLCLTVAPFYLHIPKWSFVQKGTPTAAYLDFCGKEMICSTQKKNIPIAYPTIKRKCYAADNGVLTFDGRCYPSSMTHTCQKPGHSCFRHVVSFANFPGKRTFKAVGRCLRYLCHTLLATWQIENLSQSANCIVDACDAFVKNPSKKCDACGSVMPQPTMEVFDASQTYEHVSSASVQRDLCYVLKVAVDSGNGILQSMQSSKALVSATKCLHRDVTDRQVIVSKSIESCVTYFLGFRWYEVGDR